VAPGELSEFDAKARAVVLLLRAGVEKVFEADDEVRALIEMVGEDDTEVLQKAMADAIDEIEGGMQSAIGALTVVVGRRHVAELVAGELAEFEAAKWPRDVRDKAPQA
jgi:hypothetical protein